MIMLKKPGDYAIIVNVLNINIPFDLKSYRKKIDCIYPN